MGRQAKGIARLRKEYSRRAFDEKHSSANPFIQFRRWFAEAVKSGLIEPNAMMLATVSKDGQPSLRAVLLKDWARSGFVFYTNYRSRKGRELAGNQKAALLFYWAELERQIRIEGRALKVPRAQSAKYFASRPFDAQIGALISPQSQTLSSRNMLAEAFALTQESLRGKPVSCPKHWGGYRVVPERFEFWQGREHRLHDRLVFERRGGRWRRTRLAP